MFTISEQEETKVKELMKELKLPQTKFLPIQYEGYVYNLRILQAAYKKANKRGQSLITRIERMKDGILVINYKTDRGKGRYQFMPDAFPAISVVIPEAKPLQPIERGVMI